MRKVIRNISGTDHNVRKAIRSIFGAGINEMRKTVQKMCTSFLNAIQVRPLVAAAIAVAVFAFIYVGVSENRKSEYPYGKSQKFVGQVTDKNNEGDLLKSIVVASNTGKYVCYPKSEYPIDLINIGAWVEISGKGRDIDSKMNPGEFDMQSYYRALGVVATVGNCTIDICDNEATWAESIFRFRFNLSKMIRRYCPLEYGTIETLLLGVDNDLPKDRKNLYSMVGLAHFLVISGLHISVLGSAVYKLLRRCHMKRGMAAFCGMLVIAVYGMLVGFTVSVIRAVIMYVIKLAADIVKRSYDLLSALSVAMMLSLLGNPYYIQDYGFIYSYSAVISVGIYSVTYGRNVVGTSNYQTDVGEKLRTVIIKAIGIPLAIFAGMLPVSLLLGNRYYVGAIILNMLLGVMSLPLLISALAAIVFAGMGFGVAAGIFDFFSAVILRIMDKVCKVGTAADFFAIVGQPTIWQVVIYYILLLCMVFGARYRLGNLSLLVYLVLFVFVSDSYGFGVVWSMPYVGQGDCSIIQYSKRNAIMIDCGSGSPNALGEYTIEPYLNALGITHLDDIYLSHADADHGNWILWLIENSKRINIDIGRVVLPDLPKVYQNELYCEIVDKALAADIEIVKMSAGMSIVYDKFRMNVVFPKTVNLSGDINRDSCIIEADFGEGAILLTGDSTVESENEINYASLHNIKALKVAHHGSATSSGDWLLDNIRPDIAVISCGINNRYGHPHAETIGRLRKRGIRIFRTDVDGEVRIRVKKNGRIFKISAFCN